MSEYNLAEALLICWPQPDQNALLTAAVKGSNKGLTDSGGTAIAGAMDLGEYGILTMSPTLEAVRLRANHAQRRGRVVGGSGGGGTWTLQVVAQTDQGLNKFFDDIEATRGHRFGFCLQPFRRELVPAGNQTDDADPAWFDLTATLAPAADNPLHQGHLVMTSLDPWGPGGQDPAIIQVVAEIDADYAVYYS